MEGEMDMRDELEQDFGDDLEENEDDELSASGMHVEGADDDEIEPMESDR